MSPLGALDPVRDEIKQRERRRDIGNIEEGRRQPRIAQNLPHRAQQAAKAENRQGVTPQHAEKAEKRRLAQARRQARKIQRISEREEADDPREAKIGLAPVEIAPRRIDKSGRQAGKIGNDERRPDAENQRDRIGRRVKDDAAAAQRAAAEQAERKHQLPGERVEIPAARLRPGREIDVRQAGDGVDSERNRQHRAPAPRQQRKQSRRNRDQHDIERQNVEIGELMGERQKPGEAGERIGVGRRATALDEQNVERRQRTHQTKKRDGRSRQRHMGAVKTKGAAQQRA